MTSVGSPASSAGMTSSAGSWANDRFVATSTWSES
jgi:hypothetical protein